MGLSVELFRYIKEIDYWEYIVSIYTSMITPSRNLITTTINSNYNEEITETFKWGFCEPLYYIDEEPKISMYSLKNGITKIKYSILKKAWYEALGEKLQVNNESINDNTIVCLATGG